jgi:hypothetical protein
MEFKEDTDRLRTTGTISCPSSAGTFNLGPLQLADEDQRTLREAVVGAKD